MSEAQHIGKPSYEGMRTEGKGDMLPIDTSLDIDSTSTVGVFPSTKERDTIEKSGAQLDHTVVECDEPTLPRPDEVKTNEMKLNQAIQELKANPWLAKAFLALLSMVLTELLNLDREVRYKEARGEIDNRIRIFDLAKEVAKLAKELMYNQAREQMAQALASFATAGVSAMQFMQTARNLNTAKAQTQTEIDDQQTLVTGYRDRTVEVRSGAAPPRAATDTDVEQAQNTLNSLNTNRQQSIQTKLHHLDIQTQSFAEINKQTINGVTGIIVSTYKTDSGSLEQIQKELEGLIQSFNKYSESLTKSRDDASANFNRFIDFLNKIIESNFKAQSLSRGV